jgi:hypothetical protein
MGGSMPFDDLVEYAMEVPGRRALAPDRLDQAGRLDGLRADGLDEKDLAETVEDELQ